MLKEFPTRNPPCGKKIHAEANIETMVKYLIGVAILRDTLIAFALGHSELKFSHVTENKQLLLIS